MRAIRARYNPYLQARHRVEQLKSLGHSVDKVILRVDSWRSDGCSATHHITSQVEFIVMGGTFMALDAEYRDYFIRNLHDALSGHTSNNVKEAVEYVICPACGSLLVLMVLLCCWIG